MLAFLLGKKPRLSLRQDCGHQLHKPGATATAGCGTPKKPSLLLRVCKPDALGKITGALNQPHEEQTRTFCCGAIYTLPVTEQTWP